MLYPIYIHKCLLNIPPSRVPLVLGITINYHNFNFLLAATRANIAARVDINWKNNIEMICNLIIFYLI